MLDLIENFLSVKSKEEYFFAIELLIYLNAIITTMLKSKHKIEIPHPM